MTPTELTPEQIVAMSDIIDKHYPNSDYVSYSDIRAMMTEYAASLNRQGWTRAEDVQQDFKELNVYFNDLYHHGVNQVKDSGHLWIEFSDKFRAFEKTILSMPNQTEAGRIKELEKGIKWACDNPQSVFVFNELQKLLK